MKTEASRLTSGTEIVKAHLLRKDDVIVNREGDNIPVLLATPQNGLTWIWTTSTGGFGMSPSCDVEIEKRDVVAVRALQVIRLRRDTASATDATDTVGPPMTFIGTENVHGKTLVWLEAPTGQRQGITKASFANSYVAYPFAKAGA